ncbi:MAG: bifunctional UDP-N-acetylmuramoyl-tripeptide:D-alanyl-D-alanine ligase/alanine racemase [Bacteroidales bacterium]|nr:bifunctional UDP-N-acetylmuramoyl-tripeptide:D-alanyl-D-alanine ligase/alanine racemase [Bacteroidales bacterium]
MPTNHAYYTPTELARLMKGKLTSASADKILISLLLTDSRKVLMPAQSCFFAIKTNRNDGHAYIHDLIAKGVRCFVVSSTDRLPLNNPTLCFIIVEDSLEALQQLTEAHRSMFTIPVIGITGSNGKTIVKEWLAQLLAPYKKIVRSPNSYNSQIGVPLSVWQMGSQYEMGLFEAGISLPGEMEKLQKIIQPVMGVFTNIGPAHASGFENIYQKIDEKLKLFSKSDILFYCSDHHLLTERIKANELEKKMQLISWGRGQGNYLQLIESHTQNGQTHLNALIAGQMQQIMIPFTDAASIENALHCWNVCTYLGMDQNAIAAGMTHLTPIAMRLELREGTNHSTLINDFYNSDIYSLSVALDFLQQQVQHPRKVLLLSDILESDLSEDELYKQVAHLLQTKPVDYLIGVGESLTRYSKLFPVAMSDFFKTTEQLLDALSKLHLANSAILLKGARRFGFEQISMLLQQKAHETVLEVRLNNLIHNIHYYRSLLKPSTKLMVMVKAFSYGSGSYEIASALQYHRIDYLAVAYADEGVELRKAGIELPIMVMSPEAESITSVLNYNLEPEIYNFRILNLLEASLRQHTISDSTVRIHLKIDTGMRRLGFEINELNQLIQQLKSNPQIRVISVFSHLAASESSVHDAFSLQQIQQFEAACIKLEQGLGYRFDRHILNSAGIIRFPKAQYEMVRLGIGAYGIATTESESDFLEPVLALKSTITQIKKVKAGETIGYNRSGKTLRNSVIGIVPIGYADGLPRALSNGKANLYVNGQASPIIGNICMDMCMIDLTGLQASEGDEVVIFDTQHKLTQLAMASNTIAYELLTRISRRVKRIYVQE